MCNCKKCERFVKAESIALTTPTEGEQYITITVPSDTVFSDGCWCIGLFTTIPTGVRCAYVTVTNGTDSYEIYKCSGNYWRPCELKCRSILRVEFLSDPAHLVYRGR